MSFLFWTALVLAFAASLGAGMAASALEFTAIALNRIRLLRLFADEHPEPTCEQEIFGETKAMCLVSRLALCAALAGTGLCVRAAGAPLAPSGLAAWGGGLTLTIAAIVLTAPVFLFAAHAVPRLLLRPLVLDKEEDLPALARILYRLAFPLAALLRARALPGLARFLPLRQLTKGDLVALVTELNVDESPKEQEAASPDQAASSDESAEEEEPDEEEIIYNILDLEETYVREVMKPINSVIAIRLSDLSHERLRGLARSSGYSRFPVYRERIVNLFGFISVYDALHGEETADIESYIAPAYFVPEFMRVSVLLREFLERGIQAAVVVDEYGGCSGWITREDIFEEIVGVFDPGSRLLEPLENEAYLAEGSANIDDIAEELPVRFEEPQYGTLAGFMLERLGVIPQEGDRAETEEAVFTVEKMEGNRIAQIRIALKVSEKESERDA